MKIVVEEGMEFQARWGGSSFIAKKYDYYGNGDPVLCAVTDKLILPLGEIALNSYIPKVNGMWICDENLEYVY